MMKIICYGSCHGLGGAEKTVRTLLAEMSKRGHEVYIVSKQKVDDISIISPEKLWQIADRNSVIYTAKTPVYPLWLEAKKRGIRTVHEYLTSVTRFPRLRTLPKPDYIVFNSNWTRLQYPKIKSSTVINPLIDLSEYKITETNKHYIGMINPCRYKGSDIVKCLSEKFPDDTFSLGGGWKLWYYPIKIPATKNVIWNGYDIDMNKFYSELDILIVPSHSESYGRVIIEAMYFNCAVIASNVGGIPEAMGDGGYLVNNYLNCADWEKALTEVKNNLGHYKSIAKQRVNKYDYEDNVDKWEKVFIGDFQ